MQRHKGSSDLFFLIIMGIFVVLLLWTVVGQRATDTVRDPEKLAQLIQENENIDEEMARYQVGIIYTISYLPFVADTYLKNVSGSYEALCSEGKVSRTQPDVLDGLTYISCGPTKNCAAIPYIFQTRANDRCYANRDAYVVSANGYDEDGALAPFCVDSVNSTYEGFATANPNSMRCEPVQ